YSTFRAPRDLHSFPTRRSSDLGVRHRDRLGLPRGRLDVLTARRLVAAAVRVPVTPEVELAGAGGVARVGLEQDRSLVALIGVPRRATERGGDQLPVVDVAVEEVGVLLGEDVRPGVARLVLRHPVVVVADLER